MLVEKRFTNWYATYVNTPQKICILDTIMVEYMHYYMFGEINNGNDYWFGFRSTYCEMILDSLSCVSEIIFACFRN